MISVGQILAANISVISLGILVWSIIGLIYPGVWIGLSHLGKEMEGYQPTPGHPLHSKGFARVMAGLLLVGTLFYIAG